MKFAQIFSSVRSTPMGWGGAAKKPGKEQRGGIAQTRKQLLALRPLRNPNVEWFEEEERVIIKIEPKPLKGWKLKLINLIFPLPIAPRARHIQLDRIGTDVWHLVDGARTFGQIAGELANRYQLVPREAEMQLQQYFKEIGRRGYIMFANDSAAANAKQKKKRADQKTR